VIEKLRKGHAGGGIPWMTIVDADGKLFSTEARGKLETLIPQLLAINADCRIVVLTGYASIATAVDAIKLGAIQYLAKPVEIEAILAAFETDDGPDLETAAPDEPLSVDRLEWEHIQRVLNENDGNISATARALKMHRRTLQRKLSKRPVRT
jgi:two-component system response regulator RegA